MKNKENNKLELSETDLKDLKIFLEDVQFLPGKQLAVNGMLLHKCANERLEKISLTGVRYASSIVAKQNPEKDLLIRFSADEERFFVFFEDLLTGKLISKSSWVRKNILKYPGAQVPGDIFWVLWIERDSKTVPCFILPYEKSNVE